MKKYGINFSGSETFIINSEIVSTEIGINLEGTSTSIHDCEIRKCKISNFEKAIYLKGIYNSIIDSNIIYNSMVGIYMQDYYHIFEKVVISNNIIINGDNAMTYKCLSSS